MIQVRVSEDEDDEVVADAPPAQKKQKQKAAVAAEVVRKCFFDGLDGFECKDDMSDARECFGMTGSNDARNCVKGPGNKPNYFHHFCFVNYYKDKKRKVIKEDYECNKCPACKTPLFARTKLPTLEAQGKARKAAVS